MQTELWISELGRMEKFYTTSQSWKLGALLTAYAVASPSTWAKSKLDLHSLTNIPRNILRRGTSLQVFLETGKVVLNFSPRIAQSRSLTSYQGITGPVYSCPVLELVGTITIPVRRPSVDVHA